MYPEMNKKGPMTRRRNTITHFDNPNPNMAQGKQPKLFGNQMGNRTSNSRLSLILNPNMLSYMQNPKSDGIANINQRQKPSARNPIVNQEDDVQKKLIYIKSNFTTNDMEDTMTTTHNHQTPCEPDSINMQQHIRKASISKDKSIIQPTTYKNIDFIIKEEEQNFDKSQKNIENTESRFTYIEKNENSSKALRKHKINIIVNKIPRNDSISRNKSNKEKPKTTRTSILDSNTSTINSTNHIVYNLTSNAAINKKEKNDGIKTFKQIVNYDRYLPLDRNKISRREPCKVGMGHSNIANYGKEKHVKNTNLLCKKQSQLFLAPKTNGMNICKNIKHIAAAPIDSLNYTNQKTGKENPIQYFKPVSDAMSPIKVHHQNVYNRPSIPYDIFINQNFDKIDQNHDMNNAHASLETIRYFPLSLYKKIKQ